MAPMRLCTSRWAMEHGFTLVPRKSPSSTMEPNGPVKDPQKSLTVQRQNTCEEFDAVSIKWRWEAAVQVVTTSCLHQTTNRFNWHFQSPWFYRVFPLPLFAVFRHRQLCSRRWSEDELEILSRLFKDDLVVLMQHTSTACLGIAILTRRSCTFSDI